MAHDTKRENLERVLTQIEKDHGKGAIMRLGETRAALEISTIPTGSVALDVALGVGGVPRGRIVEIYGPEASGKTTLALNIIAEVQRQGGIAAFIDAENALDPNYAENLGIHLSDLLISQPDTGEQALEIADTLIRSNAVDLIAVDSVAALVPKAELEGEMGDSYMGLQARLMSQALRKLAGNIHRSNAVAIFINQMRQKIGVMFGNPETTTGGMALKFYASVRIDVRRIETIKKGEEAIGTRVRARVVKNKVAPPFRSAEFDILFGKGIWKAGDVLDVATVQGLVEKTGIWFAYGGKKLGQGRQAAAEYLDEHPETLYEIEKALREKMGFHAGGEKKA